MAVQGLGDVGLALARMLERDGVRVIASDVRTVEGFETVPPEEITAAECDVFAPCAAGGILDAETISRLACRVVCGGANNPFATAADVDRLHARGIEYVPDFLANAGALVRGASDALGQGDLVPERMAGLADLAREIVEEGRRRGRSPHHVAVEKADARIATMCGDTVSQRSVRKSRRTES